MAARFAATNYDLESDPGAPFDWTSPTGNVTAPSNAPVQGPGVSTTGASAGGVPSGGYPIGQNQWLIPGPNGGYAIETVDPTTGAGSGHPLTPRSIQSLPSGVDTNGLQLALAAGLTGEDAVNFANQYFGGGYAYYADKNVYGIPGGNGYVGVDGSGGLFYSGGDSGGGSNASPTPGAFSYPAWTQTFSYPAWTQTFAAPTEAQAQASPGYQSAIDTANQAIQRSAAANGTLLTGGTLKDISAYDIGLADQNYQNVYQNALGDYNTALQAYQQNYNTAAQQYNQNYSQYLNGYNQALQSYMGNFGVSNTLNQNQFANYLSLAELGLNAAAGTNAAGTNFGTNAGQLITGAGNAQAAGTVGRANAINAGLGSLGSLGIYTPGLIGTGSSYSAALNPGPVGGGYYQNGTLYPGPAV